VRHDPRQLRPEELPINLSPELIEGILKAGRHETVVALVSRSDLPHAMIHEFHRHKAPDVRLAVARNRGASTDTFLALSADAEAKIRTAAVPGLVSRLSDQAESRPRGHDKQLLQAMNRLANDELAVVRRNLTKSLLGHRNPPVSILSTLARDLDREVAEPVLTGAPELSEQLLREIIENYPPPWVLKAVAQRKQLGPKLTGDIISHRDVEANGIILDNDGAEIPAASFGVLVEMAEQNPHLQEPLALHPGLPRDDALRLAYFSGERILDLLKMAKRVDPVLTRQLAHLTAQHLAHTRRIATYQDAVEEAARLERMGAITDEWLTERLKPDDPTLLIGILALRARAHPLIVKRILRSESGKAITAITWKAGFSMRTAREIMQRVAKLPSDKVLSARGGTDFPMTSRDMAWYLEFYGIEGTDTLLQSRSA